MKKTILGALLILLSSAAIFAQTTAFTYQGRLTDGGAPANGTYDFQFRLFEDAGGTNQRGTPVFVTGVQVVNGIFTVQIDFGSSPGLFQGSGERYLETRVKKPAEAGYTSLFPLQRITSAPFAIRALYATTVDEASAGNSIVNAINSVSTTFTVSENRLPANLVRIQPSSTQFSSSTNVADPVVDITGRQDNGGGSFTNISGFRFNTDGGFFTSGTQATGAVPTTGAGSRMMWYPGKYAFRVGKVDSFGATYWDESNIGFGSIALGENTRASGNNSFAANLATTASGNESVALGNNGTASADRSFTFNGTASAVGAIALGSGAQATNDDALALGPSSIAGGLASITIGPSIANGNFAVAIGLQNRAYGQFSMALGKNASTCSTYNCAPGTEKQGSIVISDGCAGFSTDAVTASANNQVNIRGCGGFRFFTNQGLTAGVQIVAGGGSWSSISDRNMKENFSAVNPRDVLQKLVAMPVSTWNYKSQDKSIRHIGVMAQDFYRTFGVGESDKMIATIDPDGVAFAAIQGLNEKLEEKTVTLEKENAELKKQLDEQQKQINAQQSAIDALKKLVCASNPGADVCKQQ